MNILRDRFVRWTVIIALLSQIILGLFLHIIRRFDFIVVSSISLWLSFLIIVLSYFSLQRAFKRDSGRFYRSIISGMAIRFVIFLLIVFNIHRSTNLSLTGFIISFVLFYVLFQWIEIRFIVSELKKK